MLSFGKVVFGKKGVLPRYGPHVSKWQKKSFASASTENEKYKTVQDIRRELIKTLGTDSSYTMKPKSKSHLMKYMVKSQSELPVRKMKDSFDSAIVPLSKDVSLREKYTNFLGHVRIGRLMEDVDLFAVWCCTRHISYPAAADSQHLPYIIVTIRVDHIEVLKSLHQPTSDVRLSGHVCWVGKSSLEVIVWLDQEVDGKWERVTRALLLMAARNPNNTGPAVVNAIEAETTEEKELFKGGEQRKMKRLEMMKESLLKKVPSEEELNLIHNLFKNTMDSEDVFRDQRVLPPKSKWMHEATIDNLVLCHPEYRNLHNKIFGGFLIRQALELSWITAYLYASRVPRLAHISDIGFYSPVDVGSLLKLNSSVTFAEGNFAQVFVYSEAYTTTNREGKSATSFYFTYDLEKPSDALYPLTYLEAMKYIDGRRHFNNFIQHDKDEK